MSPPYATPATLESLRVTLQKLEQTAAIAPDDIAELKRILLQRIAELELQFAIAPGQPQPAPTPVSN
jgi:hypothetical protein